MALFLRSSAAHAAQTITVSQRRWRRNTPQARSTVPSILPSHRRLVMHNGSNPYMSSGRIVTNEFCTSCTSCTSCDGSARAGLLLQTIVSSSLLAALALPAAAVPVPSAAQQPATDQPSPSSSLLQRITVPGLKAPPLSSQASQTAPAVAAAAPAAAPAPAGPAIAATPAPGQLTQLPATFQDLPATFPDLPATFPDLPPLQLPDVHQVALSNGLRVLLLPDHEVPLLRGALLLAGGQAASPPGKVGLASLSMSVQRAGGSASHPQQQLDEELEQLAAGIEASAGQAALSLGFQCLSGDAAQVLGLLAEVLRSPALPEDSLQLAKSQVQNLLQHQNDSPPAVARRELRKALYGAGSIYARTPTAQALSSISRQDMRDFIARWERPDAAVLGIAGDFEPEEMMRLVRDNFGSWAPAPGQPSQPPSVPTAQPPAAPSRPTALLAALPQAGQASVVVGEPGVRLGDPAAPALDVLSGVLNSFGGRLFEEVRAREGLAYNIAAGWDTPPDHVGVFVAGGDSSQPAALIRRLQEVLAGCVQQAPSQLELQQAKAQALNSFVFNFGSTTSQLARLMSYELLGLPHDYLFFYRDGIEGVTVEDVQRAAAEHLHVGRQLAVVVTSPAEVEATRQELLAAGLDVVDLRL